MARSRMGGNTDPRPVLMKEEPITSTGHNRINDFLKLEGEKSKFWEKLPECSCIVNRNRDENSQPPKSSKID